MAVPHVEVLSLSPANEVGARRGLLGWARVTVDGRVGIDGVAVRVTRAGKIVVTLPTRIDGRGDSHAVVWPLDKATRVAIESAVLDHIAGLLERSP